MESDLPLDMGSRAVHVRGAAAGYCGFYSRCCVLITGLLTSNFRPIQFY